MKLYVFLLAIALSVGVSAQSFTGDTWSKARETKSANVVLTYASLPRFSEMQDGKAFGICFDIMDDFAKYVKSTYGVQINYSYKPVSDPLNFQLFLNSVKGSKGGVFGLGDVTITPERQSIYEFSPEYFSNIAIMITAKSAPDLSSLSSISSDFSGMVAVVQRGTSHDKRMKELKRKYGGFEIEYVETADDKIQKILSSPKYFTYIDFPNYLEAINGGLDIKRHATADRKGEKFGLIMPKGSDWSPILNEFFNANGGYTSSEKYRMILADNLGDKILKLLDAFSAR